MSPTALADRLMPDRQPVAMVDAIVNGRGGVMPPSESVNRVWLFEQMVPFDATFCRSHIFNIKMGTDDPDARLYVQSVPTHPVEIKEDDRLWVPPTGVANVATCAAAPARESGFATSGFTLSQAAALVEQARDAFASAARGRKITLRCDGEKGACGSTPGKTLASIDWGALGLVERVNWKGEPYYIDGADPVDGPLGPPHVQFTFPYAADGATWVITVDRTPAITAVRMDARLITYD